MIKYVLCRLFGEGCFSDESIISVGDRREHIFVHNSCLAKTDDGKVCTRLDVYSEKRGMIFGKINGSEDENHGYRFVPSKDVFREERVTPLA